jgi:hypothetical protein
MNREKRERTDTRDDALRHAQRTGIHMGNDFAGGGGIPMMINERGNIVLVPGYLEAARKRRRQLMGARVEIEHGDR